MIPPDNKTDHRHLPDVIVVAGPTGVGKTGAAIELARCLDTEILCCDSRQLYRFLDIGTAKPTPSERASVVHHLLDIYEPDRVSTSADYRDMARVIIDDLRKRGRTAIIAGGTGLYIKAVLHGLCPAPARSPEWRRDLDRKLENGEICDLHGMLQQIDPVTAAMTDPNDRQRTIRALEFFHVTGTPISSQRGDHRFQDTPYSFTYFVLNRERTDIYRRIDMRVDAMLAAGWLDEVRRILSLGYAPDCEAMTSIGYRRLIDVIQDKLSIEEARDLIKRDTRRYAKKQLSWFRNTPETNFVDVAEDEAPAGIAARMLAHLHADPGAMAIRQCDDGQK